MARATDEMLMAYADGVLSRDDAEPIERLLREGDAECREAVDDFRKTATLVRAAFAADMAEPIPDSLVRTVLGTEASPATAPIPMRARRRFAGMERYAMAMAACLVAVMGGLALVLKPAGTGTAGGLHIGPVQANSQLANVLAKVPASTPVAGDNEGNASQLMVVSTFYDRSDRICREIELMDAALTPQQVAVACRTGVGDAWTVEGVAQIAAAEGSSSYAPAGAREKDALESLHTMLGAKPALSADEERRLIENGWR